MPIRVEELSSEVTFAAQPSVLPPAELERIVRLVLRRLEEQQRAAEQRNESSRYRSSRLPGGVR